MKTKSNGKKIPKRVKIPMLTLWKGEDEDEDDDDDDDDVSITLQIHFLGYFFILNFDKKMILASGEVVMIN